MWPVNTRLVHHEVGPHVGPGAPVVEPDDLLVVVHAEPAHDGLGELVRPGAVHHREEVPDETLAPAVNFLVGLSLQNISKLLLLKLKYRVLRLGLL